MSEETRVNVPEEGADGEQPEAPKGDEEEEEEEDYDPYAARDAEERQKSFCDRNGCIFALLGLVLLFILLVGFAAFCIYLGRFSVWRGIKAVKLAFDSITWSNSWKAITGQEIVWATEAPHRLPT